MRQVTTPVLPSAPPQDDDTQRLYPELVTHPSGQYRLQKISEIQRDLEKARDLRHALYKKHKRGVNASDAIDAGLTFVGVGFCVSDVGLLVMIVAAPVVLSLEIAAVTCGFVGVISKFTSCRLSIKCKKHDEIRVLAEAKLNSISSLVSKALQNNTISKEEFKLILGEKEKFTQMKDQIRVRAKKAHMMAIDEA